MTMPKLVYISGPMSGLPNNNMEAFSRAAFSLAAAGCQYISPPEEDSKIPESELVGLSDEAKWRRYLHRDLKDLLNCQAIHMLDGWERSRGATLEMMNAKELGMEFVDANGCPVDSPRAPHESILVEAERITNGPRRKTYGHPLDNFQRTADFWSPILGIKVSAEQVGLCMVALKLARLCHSMHRDGLVDGAGYFNTLDMISLEREAREIEAMRERVA